MTDDKLEREVRALLKERAPDAAPTRLYARVAAVPGQTPRRRWFAPVSARSRRRLSSCSWWPACSSCRLEGH